MRKSFWFGMPFHPNCTLPTRLPVPVGRKCSWCDEPIEACHSGAVVQGISAGPGNDGPLANLPGVRVLTVTMRTDYYHHECIELVLMVDHPCPGCGEVHLSSDDVRTDISRRQLALEIHNERQADKRPEAVN